MSWFYARVIGENIRKELDKQELSVTDFADKLGWTTTEAYRLLDGVLEIKISDLDRIADTLHINVEKLSRRNSSETLNKEDMTKLFLR